MKGEIAAARMSWTGEKYDLRVIGGQQEGFAQISVRQTAFEKRASILQHYLTQTRT